MQKVSPLQRLFQITNGSKTIPIVTFFFSFLTNSVAFFFVTSAILDLHQNSFQICWLYWSQIQDSVSTMKMTRYQILEKKRAGSRRRSVFAEDSCSCPTLIIIYYFYVIILFLEKTTLVSWTKPENAIEWCTLFS